MRAAGEDPITLKNQITMADFGKVFAAFVGGAVLGTVAVLLATDNEKVEAFRARVERIVREKYGNLNKEELQAMVDRVIAKVKEVLPDADIRAVVDEIGKEETTQEA